MQGELTKCGPTQSKLFHIKPARAVQPSELGEPPRQRIPLVLVLTKDHASPSGTDTDVVALLVSVHISDEEVTMDTCFLEQYLKVANGRTCLLKPLYVSTDGTGQSADECRTMCVVCQTAPVTCAILPCRHACVCDTCFSKLDICPMCRSHIVSFFNMTSLLRSTNQEDAPVSVAGDMMMRRRPFPGEVE